MHTLFLDVLGNKKFVDGYQIDDSIAKKWHLEPGNLAPFSRFRVEALSPEIEEKLKKAERLKINKEQKEALKKKGNPQVLKKEATTMAKPAAKAKAAVKKSVTKKAIATKAKPVAKKTVAVKAPVTKKATKAKAKPVTKAKAAAKAPVTKKATSKAKPTAKKTVAKKS
jgi:hypothetical protein